MGKFTKNWLKAAAVRAIKTVAQATIASIGTTAAMGDVNWVMVGSTAALAGVLSVLTSVAGLPEITEGE
nr:MAG TPA: holin [Caudoviricetes sp.]